MISKTRKFEYYLTMYFCLFGYKNYVKGNDGKKIYIDEKLIFDFYKVLDYIYRLITYLCNTSKGKGKD